MEVSKILTDFMPFLGLDWYTPAPTLLQNNWLFYSECSISLLNLIVFVTARDIRGFLTLSSRLQIHENATEIAPSLKEDFMQRHKVSDRL